MDIPCTIYVSKLDIYEILTQRSVCWPPGRQRLHWQFHIDVPKGKKKHQGHSDIFAPCVLFCALIFGLNESEKWLFYPTERVALTLKSNQLTELGEEFFVPYMSELTCTFRIIFPVILFLISVT